MRLLHRLRPGHHRRNVDQFAVIFRLRLGPDLLHRLDALAHELEARFEDRPMVLHLVLVPAAADAEDEPAVRQLVEGRHLLRRLDRVALHDQADTRAQLQRRRHRRDGGQCHERVHHVVILLRQVAAAAEGRLAGQRDVRVLRHPERFEPPLLQRPPHVGRLHRIVRREIGDAEIHLVLPLLSSFGLRGRVSASRQGTASHGRQGSANPPRLARPVLHSPATKERVAR